MSILFDNADDYADTSGTPPVIGYPCTIVAWAKPAALGSQDRILHLGRNDSTNVDSFVLRKTSGDLLQDDCGYVAPLRGYLRVVYLAHCVSGRGCS